jgi:hypothetical protein
VVVAHREDQLCHPDLADGVEHCRVIGVAHLPLGTTYMLA